MVNYKAPEDWKKKPYEKAQHNEAIAFVQQGVEKVGKKSKSTYYNHDLSNDKCYACGKMGHHAHSCPNMTDEDCKEIAGVNHCEVAEEIVDEEFLEGVAFLQPAESKERPTLDWWKLYLDSCATYNQVFVDYLLTNIGESSLVQKANCNAGTTMTNIKGCWNEWTMWLNRQGIANIVSIPWLKDHGYKIDYHSDREWVVFTPSGKEIIFKQDTGKCNHMPYIDMHEHKKAFAIVQTVHKNFEGCTKKKVEKATYAC